MRPDLPPPAIAHCSQLTRSEVVGGLVMGDMRGDHEHRCPELIASKDGIGSAPGASDTVIESQKERSRRQRGMLAARDSFQLGQGNRMKPCASKHGQLLGEVLRRNGVAPAIISYSVVG